MAVRINRIVKPADEMAECRKQIKEERRMRASLRLQADPEYVEQQLAYLNTQIASLEARKADILRRQAEAGQSIAASQERTQQAQKRHAALKHREKVRRAEERLQQAATLRAQLEETHGLSPELIRRLELENDEV